MCVCVCERGEGYGVCVCVRGEKGMCVCKENIKALSHTHTLKK